MTYVEFSCEALTEDAEVRGNVMASGDDDFDRECEDKVLADIEDGNEWAWASVRVSARIGGTECADYVGQCQYKDQDAFEADALYFDMKAEALSELRKELEDALDCAEKEIAAERKAYDKRQALIELWRCPHCKEVVAVDPGYDDIPFCADCDTQRDRFDPVDVVFLRDSDGGDLHAVFPGLASSAINSDLMACYAHIGQHGSESLQYCNSCIEVTDPVEYDDLATELERIGYSLYVVSKSRMDDSKYADQRRRQLRM